MLFAVSTAKSGSSGLHVAVVWQRVTGNTNLVAYSMAVVVFRQSSITVPDNNTRPRAVSQEPGQRQQPLEGTRAVWPTL